MAYLGFNNMHQISIQEAEFHFAGILSEVRNGEEVILTDHDSPVVKMIPLSKPHTPRGLVGSLKGKIWIADDFDETPDDFKDYI
jgi:antitoxin (DNA-binding transcriptional repressor) of toxin-antitoxin stability system